jgi:hypothetical protein
VVGVPGELLHTRISEQPLTSTGSLYYIYFIVSISDTTSESAPVAWEAELSALKERLEEIIRRPKVTPRDADEAGEAAKALADLLRGEERALRLLRARGSPSDAGQAKQAKQPYLLTGLTLHEAAQRVLDDAGWPMHVRELGTLIKIRGWRHPRSTNAPPDQIQFQLAARLPRHPDVFKKFAPNTFGLAKWGEAPPRTERPKPRLGLLGTDPAHEGPSARWLSEHDDEWYDDMVKDERG